MKWGCPGGGAIGTSKPILVGGLKFGSQQAAALHFGIDPSVFNLRINRLGWTPEEAAELKLRTFQRIRVELATGEKFESLKSAARSYGLDYKLVHDRYKSKHWTLEQSLGIEDPPRVPKKKVTIFGQEYESISHAARSFGLKPDTLSARLRRGLRPEESVTMDTRKGPK